MSARRFFTTFLLVVCLSFFSFAASENTEMTNDSVPRTGDSDSLAVSNPVRDFRMEQMFQEANLPLEFSTNPVAEDDLYLTTESFAIDSLGIFTLPEELRDSRYSAKGIVPSIYDLPYSMTGRAHDWHRLWINTAVLSGAFVGTLFVLECLPEDATAWNRAEIQRVPMFTRWYNHVIKEGPEWDHDKFIFNYVLHPYAGAVYFMSARSCGFNFWQSLLYSAIISDVGWEFGIEAFMERPSYQDMVITPVVGSAIGEGFYRLKRYIVEHDYRLFGSPVVGNIVAFLIDPVDEVVGLFDHNPARAVARRLKEERGESVTFMPTVSAGFGGFSLAATF